MSREPVVEHRPAIDQSRFLATTLGTQAQGSQPRSLMKSSVSPDGPGPALRTISGSGASSEESAPDRLLSVRLAVSNKRNDRQTSPWPKLTEVWGGHRVSERPEPAVRTILRRDDWFAGEALHQ
jgi:hypothetical protein